MWPYLLSGATAGQVENGLRRSDDGSSQPVGGGSDPLAAMLDEDHPTKLAAAAWADRHLAVPGEPTRELWQAAAEFGVQKLLMPIEQGGTGGTAVETLLTLEGLGLGARNNGLVFALASQVVAAQRALALFGTKAQNEEWLQPLVNGSLFGSFCMTEREAGSAIGDAATEAHLQTDGSYRLQGTKAWASLAPLSDVALVFATTDRSKGVWGLTCFIVDTRLDGVVKGAAEETMGLAGCPIGAIDFNDVQVGADRVLGRPGAGSSIFSTVVDAERAFLYAAQLGAVESVLARAIDRSRSRVQGGVNIGSFQAVAHRVVEMKLRHETGRLLVYKAAALHDRGEPLALAAALAKMHVAESSVKSAVDAMKIFGAEGYSSAAGIESELRDAMAGLSYSGTADVARNIVASMLRLDRPHPKPSDRSNTSGST